MLMAEQLAPSHFRIIDFSLDEFSGSHTHFRRDPLAHRAALNDFFERTGRDFPRFNYLGEWHSHPAFSVHPSLEDVTTMTNLVDGSGTAITFAVLLIVRLRWGLRFEYSLFLCAAGQQPVELRLS
jgi:[CysO sulfur-carrier protein]-S-L-cysteine hydrolase